MIRNAYPRTCILSVLMTLSAIGPLLAQSNKATITCNSPGNGFMSIGLYDANNTLIRNLAYGQPVTAGQTTFAWDYTSNLGLPVAPGKYTARGIWYPQTPQINFKTRTAVSGHPFEEPVNTAGGWGGDLGPPQAVCSNGTQVAAVFLCSEGSLDNGAQLVNANGDILQRYYNIFPWGMRMAAVMDTTFLYIAESDISQKRLAIVQYRVNENRGINLVDIPVGNNVTLSGRWKGRWTTDVRGLALAGGRLYIPLNLDNKLVIVDIATKSIVKTVSYSSPRGVAAYGNNIYLLSGTKLLKLGLDGIQVGSVPVTTLTDPSGIAIDGTGNFYISDRGTAQKVANRATTQRVKVYSPAGTELRAIGTNGGRPRNGIYQATGMLEPGGICLGPNGQLWVAETNEDFQRVSVWNSSTGQLQKEFFNTRLTHDQGAMSPDNKEMVFTYDNFADAPGITGYKIDPVAGTWSPSWHRDMLYSQMQQENVLLGNNHIFDQLAVTFNGRAPYLSFAGEMVQANNGKTYIVGGDCSIWLFDNATKNPKLAALPYPHRAYKLADGRYQGEYDQGFNNWFAWADLNGDGTMGLNEVRYTINAPKMEKTGRLMGWQLQKDLSLLMLCSESVNNQFNYVVRRLRPRQVLSSGVPVYDWADVQDVVSLKLPNFTGGDGWKLPSKTFLDGIRLEGNKVTTWAVPSSTANFTLSGATGWSTRNWRQTPLMFDITTGNAAWNKLGRRAPAQAIPGEMYFPRYITSSINGFVFVADTVAQVWVWTNEGQYVGKLYNDPFSNILTPNTIFAEILNCHQYKIGEEIYAMTGEHGVKVHQVILPTLTTINAGTVDVTPTNATLALPWDPDGPIPH